MSPAPRRTQAERLELSGRRLLTAAAELICEQGWEATTAADISRRAGYSRAMVHARFGTKDALLDILLGSEYEGRLEPAAGAAGTGLEQVLAPFARLRALHDDDPAFLESMFVLNFEAVKRGSALRPRIIDWLRRIATMVRSGLEAGLADGTIRAGTGVDAAVSEIIGAGVGAAYGWIVLPEQFDLPAELDRIARQITDRYGVG